MAHLVGLVLDIPAADAAVGPGEGPDEVEAVLLAPSWDERTTRDALVRFVADSLIGGQAVTSIGLSLQDRTTLLDPLDDARRDRRLVQNAGPGFSR